MFRSMFLETWCGKLTELQCPWHPTNRQEMRPPLHKRRQHSRRSAVPRAHWMGWSDHVATDGLTSRLPSLPVRRRREEPGARQGVRVQGADHGSGDESKIGGREIGGVEWTVCVCGAGSGSVRSRSEVDIIGITAIKSKALTQSYLCATCTP